MKDLNGAFPRTPEAVEDAIHEGIRRGRRRELRRARLRRAACVAAVVAVMVGAFSLALNRDRLVPSIGPGGNQVLSKPSASASVLPSPAPTQNSATATPEPTATGLPALIATEAPLETPVATEIYGPVAIDESALSTPVPSITPEPTDASAGLSQAMGTTGANAYADSQELLNMDPLEISAYYSTDTGDYFHTFATCSGMVGAQERTAREALEMGQDFCPVCFNFAQYVGDPAWSLDEDEYYHADRDCAGIGPALEEIESGYTYVYLARLAGKLPCPDCIIWQQTTPAILSGALYCTDGGTFVHSVSNCTGMLNASACTLAQALVAGKVPCPTCIGAECIYVNGIYWNSATDQLLLSVDMYADSSAYDTVSGGHIDLSAMEDVDGGLNAWDAAVLDDAWQSGNYEPFRETGEPMRVDVKDLEVEMAGWDCLASMDYVDAGGRHVRLLYDGVTVDELDALEFSVSATARYYCISESGDFVRSASAVTVALNPIGSDLDYSFDNDSHCVSFMPGALLMEYSWAYGNAAEAMPVLNEDGESAAISAYQFDVAGDENTVILEVRANAGTSFDGLSANDACWITTGLHAEGDEVVYTAVLPATLAEEIFNDPALLGFYLDTENTASQAAVEETPADAVSDEETAEMPAEAATLPEDSLTDDYQTGMEAAAATGT